MTKDFYDKVAKKFGNYSNPAKYTQEFKAGEPEKIFKEKLLELSGKEKTVLDSGCGDGRFTLEIAQHFKKVIGNDTSKLMLKAALALQKEKEIKNVEFIEVSTNDLTIEQESLDIVYARRAETNYPLFYKMLKVGGYVLSIEIGEKDTMELQKVFGRGQNYGDWSNSRLERDKKLALDAGYKVIYGKTFYHTDIFATKKDLDIFLQGVPIFEDYDSEKDKKFLEEYVRKNISSKGVELSRHRYIIVAKKV